ncbi:MAG TPA: FtsX-like permease family protein, partial [Candidatus Angelobacter sp.]
FRTYPNADIWLPLQLKPGTADPGNNYRVIGRLASGITRQQAQYELDRLAREYQLTYLPSSQRGTLAVQDLHSFLIDKQRRGLAILFEAVAFLFLIACTNVAVLVMVRTEATSHAVAVRMALGSSRLRLLFPLLTESFLLSLVGGVLGLILTKESLPLVVSLWPANVPLTAKLSIDIRVALFTFTISILSPLLFALAPAMKLSRLNVSEVLANTSRTATASTERVRAIRWLVFGEMALTVMLLAGTVLLLRSLVNLYSVPLGFDTERLAVAQISLAGERYAGNRSMNQLLDQVITQLEGLPGVETVTAVNGLPLENGLNLPLHPVAMPHSLDHADQYRPVSPDYFKTLRIALRSGRFFTPADTAGSAPVAIINETLARHWWPKTSAIGNQLRVDEELGPHPADAPRLIVGVVSDIHEKGPDLPPPPTMFIPIGQTPDNINAFFNKVFLTSIVIRTAHRIDLSGDVRRAIQSADPDLPLASYRQFTQIVDHSVANARFMAFLTTSFGIFALVLSAVGIHGLFNYQTRLRYREIAVRMAVGASRIRIFLMIVQQGDKLIFLAVLVGLAGFFIIKNLLTGLLYNVKSGSLTVIIGTGVLLGSVATLISLLAAFRAASIEPTAVLRNE